jgi:gluconokinase
MNAGGPGRRVQQGGEPVVENVVVGVDIGTTAVKVVAYRPDGASAGDASRGYPLHSPEAGWAEQDPDEIVTAVLDGLAEVVAAVAPERIAGIGISSVMHSLVGVDADGAPLTPSLTFADSRAWPQALRLRRDRGIALYRETGTPIHPMAPLAKLLWFGEHRPDLMADVARWVSIKEYLLDRMCGSDLVDVSVASATGLFDLAAGRWHTEALELAGIDAGQLGTPVATDTVIDGLRPPIAERVGIPADTPVVIGATDGVLANLGVGATTTGTAALSIGTSGAIRVVAPEPRTDPQMRTFCYALSEGRWVLGGAISNGGLTLGWLAEQLLGEPDYDKLTAEAADVAVGSDGVIMLPYLTGERAPRWSPLQGAVLFGLRHDHTRGHAVRAALEGVALQLRLVADALRDADAGFTQLRVTGGFVASDLWLQIVADVLGSALQVPRVEEATAHGAALLARRGLGHVDDLDEATAAIEVARTVEPDARARTTYDDVAVRYARLVDSLGPLLEDTGPLGQGGATDM